MLIDQLNLLTTCLFELNDVIELRHLGDKPVSSWHLASNLHAVCEPIEQHNRTHNCYFGCNPRKHVGGRSAADVRLARSLCVEWDETSWPQAWHRIKSASLPDPTLVIWSGGGPHCYWRLTQPVTNLGTWSMYQKALIRLLCSDGCIHDAPRIMRLPGTWNHKRLTYAKVLWADPGARYRVDELLYRVPVVERVRAMKTTAVFHDGEPDVKSYGRPIHSKVNYATAALMRECQRMESTPSGYRNAVLCKSAFKIGQLIGADLLDGAQAFCALLDATHAWESSDAIEGPKIMAQIEAGMNHPRSVELRGSAA